MFQQLVIVGNLGRDPEMRYTPSGKAVTNMNVATNERWTDNNGEVQERTVWFRITAWGKLAEVCNLYLCKGRQVMVVGKLSADEHGGPRIWEAQDGSPRANFEVTAREVKFLGGAGSGGNSSNEQEYDAGSIAEDEIPF